MSERFEAIIRKRLAELDMNISELARHAGFSTQYVHDLVNGHRRWNIETMEMIGEVVGVYISYEVRETRCSS